MPQGLIGEQHKISFEPRIKLLRNINNKMRRIIKNINFFYKE